MVEEPEGGFLLDMRMGLGGTPHVMDTFSLQRVRLPKRLLPTQLEHDG